MRLSFLLGVSVFASIVVICSACSSVVVSRDGVTPLVLQQLSLQDKVRLLTIHTAYVDSGRPIYVYESKSKPSATQDQKMLYLYHCRYEWTGEGRWEFGNSFCNTLSDANADNTDTKGNIAAFVLSWAVTPHLINAVADTGRSVWRVNYDILEALRWNTGVTESAETGFVADKSLSVSCAASANEFVEDAARVGVVYFEGSARTQPRLAGFYIQHTVADNSAALNGTASNTGVILYTQVRESPTEDQQLYLFSLPSTVQCENAGESAGINSEAVCSQQTTWLIGDRYGEDAGLAFTRTSRVITSPDATTVDDPNTAAAHTLLPLPVPVPPQEHQQWSFVDPAQGDQWTVDPTAVLYSAAASDSEGAANSIYEVLRSARSIRSLPTAVSSGILSGELMLLRNGYRMPQIGLGTGGIYLEDAPSVFATALRLGYRSLDLAREYGNEHIVPLVLDCLDPRKGDGKLEHCADVQSAYLDVTMQGEQRGSGVPPPTPLITRRDLFLESKVWPTELGFLPTTRAVRTSLQHLRSNYLDLYLLHWPRCDPGIDWMHCETTEQPDATWRESYWALQRAYAEGRVMAVGVSNFDAALLDELMRAQGTLLHPHVVQNWAEPGQTDANVRQMCTEHKILYQPYAPLRNLQYLPPRLQQSLRSIGKQHAVSAHAVALRYFLQLGATVIPRSHSFQHLQENLAVGSWVLSTAEMQLLGDAM